MMAYSCRSTLLLLVNGGSSSSIGFISLPPPACGGQRTRRMKAVVALSEALSFGEDLLETGCLPSDGCLD